MAYGSRIKVRDPRGFFGPFSERLNLYYMVLLRTLHKMMCLCGIIRANRIVPNTFKSSVLRDLASSFGLVLDK